MNSDNDLITRLRQFGDSNGLDAEAADEIERLNRKVERLTYLGNRLYKIVEMLREPGSPPPPPEISFPMDLWWGEVRHG